MAWQDVRLSSYKLGILNAPPLIRTEVKNVNKKQIQHKVQWKPDNPYQLSENTASQRKMFPEVQIYSKRAWLIFQGSRNQHGNTLRNLSWLHHWAIQLLKQYNLACYSGKLSRLSKKNGISDRNRLMCITLLISPNLFFIWTLILLKSILRVFQSFHSWYQPEGYTR